MYVLEDILSRLKASLSALNVVESVSKYRDNLVVVELKTDQLHFAIDITEKMDVFLVFRNDESRRFLSCELNTRLAARTQIADQNGSLVSFIDVDSFQDMESAFRRIILHLTSYERHPSSLLQRSVKQLNMMAEHQRLATQRETICSMAGFYRDRFLSIPETLQRIKKNRLSIARYGDGEIKCMVTASGCRFQRHDWKLMYELRDIASQKSDLLVCFPGLLPEDRFWQNFWPEYWPMCQFYINQDVIGDSMVTRPEAFYAYGNLTTSLWMDLWENEDACFVTGESSRMDASHEIFSNLKSSSYVPSKNNDAYDDIDNALQRCLEQKNTSIYLIALGPAGTALASRLQKKGKWALDIGHLNNSFDTVFHNAARPEKISYPRI